MERVTRALGGLLMIACAPCLAHAASATLILDADVGVVYESNVGFAQLGHDIKGDAALTTSVSAGTAVHIDDRNVLSLTGDVGGTAYDRLKDLTNLSIGVTTALQSKLGLGAAAPWVRVWGSGARLEYDNEVRDGWRYRVGAGVGKRFGEQWDLRFDYTFEERLGDHGRAVFRLPGDVFDTTSHTFAVRTDFLYNDAITIFTGYALRDGDVVSTTRRDPKILAVSSALAVDPAFGRGFVAYKIDAVVHVLSLGLSYALGPHTSLNVGYDHQIGVARGGFQYRNDVARAAFLYRY